MIGYKRTSSNISKTKSTTQRTLQSPTVEVQLRDQCAQKSHEGTSGLSRLLGIINHYLRVVTPQSSKKLADCPLAPDLQTFIDDNRNRLKLAMQSESIMINSVLNRLTKQVAPSLKMVQQVDSLKGNDMSNEVELSPQQKTSLKEVFENKKPQPRKATERY